MEKEKSFYDLIGKLETWQAFTILVIIVIFYFVSKYDLINKYLSGKKRLKILTKEELMSLELERIKKEIIESRLKNIEVAAHQAVEALKNCIGANYYIIHDSGEDLSITEKWFLTVLRSTSYAIQTDYEKPQEITEGYKKLNILARDRLFYVVNNVEEDDRFKKELDYLKIMDIKSFCSCLVKNNGNSYHMVSFNFDNIDPMKENPDLRRISFAFKRAVLANI